MPQLRTTRVAARASAALAAAAASAFVLAAAGCGHSEAGAGAPVPSAVIGRLTVMAYRAAAVKGDPHRAWITAVRTTRARALTSATPGDYYIPGFGHR